MDHDAENEVSPQRENHRDSHEVAEQPSPVEIPFEMLSEDAQVGVIDDFIWREGTDYGAHEVSMETKRAQIRGQIVDGKVRVVFDPALESITLMTDRDWKKIRPAGLG